MGKIKVAVAGLGNCCSALVQGTFYYNQGESVGLINEKVGNYSVSDIEFVAAFDIDRRKVGEDISKAIFSEPNQAPRIVGLSDLGVTVRMGCDVDGGENMTEDLIEVASEAASNISQVLVDERADVLVNLISGSAVESSKFYAEAALEAGCSFLNATPSPVASDENLSNRFVEKKLPLAGDDLLDQIGATVTHIGLLEFLLSRGVRIDESYQLDVGGGAESVNTLWRTRGLKRDIKTAAVASSIPYDFSLVSGSTDYVDFLGNQRDSFFWFKGRYFGGSPFTMDIRLNTVDAPNAGAVLLDVIRGLKLASKRGLGGPILPLCAYGFKRPPERYSLGETHKLFRDFIEA